MKIGTSIVVMALGAVLAFAVEAERTEGFNINTAGIILMVAGALGLIVTTIMYTSREDRVVERPRERVVEREV